MCRCNRLGLLTLLSTFALTCYGEGNNPADLGKLKTKAEEARVSCGPKIHFDTYTFERCINTLSHAHKKDPISQLGIEYAGFAVALSTTRVGMTGAEDTARHFYWRYRTLQTKLGIDDMALCNTLPGNCQIRVAQTIELAKQPRLKSTAASLKQTSVHDH